MRLLRLAALLLLPVFAQAEPVRLVFVGDVMLDDGPGRLIAAGGDPLLPFAKLLHDADYAVANLECPVAASGKPMKNKPFVFRADPAVLRVLKGRFDAVALANNHSGDQGKDAFLETLSRLDGAGIAHFGGGRNLAAAHAPLWVEFDGPPRSQDQLAAPHRGAHASLGRPGGSMGKGLRIALLAYNEFKPRSFEAGAEWPGIAWSEDSQVVADIRAAKAAGADLVIPFMHWGWEMEPAPGERQRRLARLMIDAGADAVVGGHPHVVQGAEIYKGRPIVYSLGNFVFDGFEDPAGRLGWLLYLTVDKGGVTAWETREARMDDDGTPHPAPGARTPCGKAGDAAVGLCANP